MNKKHGMGDLFTTVGRSCFFVHGVFGCIPRRCKAEMLSSLACGIGLDLPQVSPREIGDIFYDKFSSHGQDCVFRDKKR